MTTVAQDNLAKNIEDLYAVFSPYTLPKTGIQTCLDFGPSEEEEKALALPLREVPYHIIRRTEFYDTTWDNWGSEAEVKYLLPRIFETFVNELVESHDISDIGAFSTLIRFKMLDLNNESSKWTTQESASLKRFFLSLFEFLANEHAMVVPFIDYLGLMTVVREDITPLTAIWDKVPASLKSTQIQRWVITYMDPETLGLKAEPIFTDESAKARVVNNLESLKQWVLREDHILNNMDFFSEGPWYNLVIGIHTKD